MAQERDDRFDDCPRCEGKGEIQVCQCAAVYSIKNCAHGNLRGGRQSCPDCDGRGYH